MTSSQKIIDFTRFSFARQLLNTEIIRSMWFPLAPIGEQHRIVTRISEVMPFCDVLEANLKHVSVVGKRLAIAAISSLTGIALEQEDDTASAPQTEEEAVT